MFSKNIPIQNYMNIRPMGAELLHADIRQTYRHDEANSRFLNFGNTSKIEKAMQVVGS
jgi:hypothetical protein